MFPPAGLAILIGFVAFVALVVWRSNRRDASANWPVTEGTIQSVGQVVVNGGKTSYTVDVGDFSYKVNDEFYSGRVRLSPSSSTEDRAPRVLIHQKIQVRYDPQKPEKNSTDNQEVEGFPLDSWDENLGADLGPIDLNIDKFERAMQSASCMARGSRSTATYRVFATSSTVTGSRNGICARNCLPTISTGCLASASRNAKNSFLPEFWSARNFFAKVPS
jgi:hypothetical protein